MDVDLSGSINTVKNNPVTSAMLTAFGAVVTALVAYLRNQLRIVDYRVNHSRLAFSSEDAVFGVVKVSWDGVALPNLFLSEVVVENCSGQDLKDLEFKVFTGEETLLLSEKPELVGSAFPIDRPEGFKKVLYVPPGAEPTKEQMDIYRHQREYRLSVFNRGDKVIARFLTTVMPGAAGPSVWVDSRHCGVKVRFRPAEQEVHAAPLRWAIRLGLATSVVVLLLCWWLINKAWISATVCMVVGLFAQLVGAWIYHGLRFVKAIVRR